MPRPTHDDGSKLIFSENESLAAGILASICSLLGTISNLATIYSLAKSKKLRSHPTTLFLISLAVSDLVFSVYNLPVNAHRFFHRGCEFMCLPPEMCNYFPYFLYGNVGVSMYIMALIALQRVIGMFRPSSVNLFNKVTVPIMIILVWILIFGALTLPLTQTWGQFGFEPLTFSCTFLEKDGYSFMSLASLGGILPSILIIISYSLIYFKVWKTGKETLRGQEKLVKSSWTKNLNFSNRKKRDTSYENKYQTSDFRSIIQKRERDLTKTVFYIFVSYITCFLPFALLSVLDKMPPSRNTGLHLFAYSLTWASAFINPIIYCYTNKHYKAAYEQALFENCLERFASIRQSAGEGGPQEPVSVHDIVEQHHHHGDDHGEHSDLLEGQRDAEDYGDHHISVAKVYVEKRSGRKQSEESNSEYFVTKF